MTFLSRPIPVVIALAVAVSVPVGAQGLLLSADSQKALHRPPRTEVRSLGIPDGKATHWIDPAPISSQEYAARREAVVEAMDDGLFLLLGSPEPALDYLPFAQRANFRYLTGITEPGAALIIEKRGSRAEELLFVLPRDPTREAWEGRRLGAEGAMALTGVPSATVDRLFPELEERLSEHRVLYTVGGAPPAAGPGRVLDPEQQFLAGLLEGRSHLEVRDLAPALTRLRAYKSPGEIDLLRRAVHITVLAHQEVMRATAPGFNEFEIQALIEYTFRRHGAERPGFSSIVGSGPNSTTLHYNDNDRFMGADDVLLMDIGASYRGYTADITRTIPVRGTFSSRQREVYQVVLDAMKAAEGLLRPGATWDELNAAAEAVIARGLAELGLVDGPDATYQCQSPRFGMICPQYRLYFMHGMGHGIGLDVHDPEASYYGPTIPGSVFTMEPGVYIRADALDYLPDTPENRAMAHRLGPALERYADIGVRIEDNYLVTADGFERLSAGVPREVAEVEALMREAGRVGAPRIPEVLEWYRKTEWVP
jgi:Xaa-Pro aminopeptidase